MPGQRSIFNHVAKIGTASLLAGALTLAFGQSTEGTSSFPTAEDFLATQGLDPRLAVQLAGRAGKIRVFTTDGLADLSRRVQEAIPRDTSVHTGYLRSLMQGIERLQVRQDWPASYRKHDLERGWLNFRFSEFESPDTECFVMPARDTMSAKKIVSILSGINPEYLDDVTVSPDLLIRFILLHEIKHCKPDSLSHQQAEEESASDIAGLKTLDNPALSFLVLHSRASQKFADSHSTAMPLEAMIKGVKPDTQGIWEAEEQLDEKTKRYRFIYQEDLKGKPVFLANAHALRYILRHQNDGLTPLARHRALMFLTSIKTIASGAVSREFGTDLIPAAVNKDPLAEKAFDLASSALQYDIHPDTAKSYYDMLCDFIYIQNRRSKSDNLSDFHLTPQKMISIARHVKTLELKERHTSLRRHFLWNNLSGSSYVRKLEAHIAMQQIARELAQLEYDMNDERTYSLIGSTKKEFSDNLEYTKCLVLKTKAQDCTP